MQRIRKEENGGRGRGRMEWDFVGARYPLEVVRNGIVTNIVGG